MSASKICIDWGNTLVKIALFDRNDKITDKYVLKPEEVIDQLHKEITPRREFSGAIISSVTNQHSELEQALRTFTPHVIVLNNRTPLPILNAYGAGEQLGADRIALACAAHSEFPGQNNLVICVGTCITYNFLGSNRAFRGGAISPGIQMRLDAMHEHTAKLPKVNMEGDLMLVGYDTVSCMRSGAINGVLAELDGMVQQHTNQFGDFNAILTGGDAPLFAGKMKSKIFADPEFVMKGLNQILKHNVPQTL